MQLVVSGNRILAHGEGFLAMGGTVINTNTGRAYHNATVVECDGCPSDIDKVGYEYHAGQFVPCAPFGMGDGNIAVVCGEDCKSIKDSGKTFNDIPFMPAILSAATKTMYGLSEDATPNTIFQKLAMPLNTYGFEITVVLENGTPVSGVTISGDILDINGKTAVTDADGKCLVYSETAATSVSIEAFFCTKALSKTLQNDASHVFTPVTLTIENDTSTSLFLERTSKTVRHLGNVSAIDVCTVGGGGAGGAYGAHGGGGGFVTNTYNVDLKNKPAVTFEIGAGATARQYGTGTTTGTGGTTKFFVDGKQVSSATGGTSNSGDASKSNGAGSFYDTAGQDGKTRVFDDPSLPLPGGGGGGAGNGSTPAGGKDFGGKGVNYKSDAYGTAQSGTGPGGGGGAGYEGRGGNGGAGGVYYRVKEFVT